MWNFLKTVGKGLVGIAEDIFAVRRENAKAKIELKKVKVKSQAKIEVAKAEAAINLAANAQNHAQEWERIMAAGQSSSWKDEYILILFSIPLVMAFVPTLAPYVSKGFAELETAPDWYLQVVLAGAAVAYGLRNLTKLPIPRRRTPPS